MDQGIMKAEPLNRILFVMDQGIGNMVMATPALQAIRDLYPDCWLDVFASYPANNVIENACFVNRVLTEPDDSARYNIILLSVWHSNFLRLVGKEWIRARANRSIQANMIDFDKHECDFHMALAREIGYKGETPAPYCDIIPHFVTRGYTRIGEMTKPVILADCATSSAWEAKRWPYFPELASRLLAENEQVVLIGSEKEESDFNPLDWPSGINPVFDFSISEIAKLCEESKYVVANDCGPAHIAAAVGAKTFVLFGPTRESKNCPIGKNVVTISLDMACQPCQYETWQPICRENECLQDLSVDDVRGVIENAGKHGQVKLPVFKKEKTKLIAAMRIKDAIPTLRASLNSINRVVDAIVVVDNGSTDGSLEAYSDYEKIIEVHHTKGLDEPRDRAVLDSMIRKHKADWVLFIDADEVLEAGITRPQVTDWMKSSEYNAIWFRHVHFWPATKENENDEDAACPLNPNTLNLSLYHHYRVDQRWKPRHRRGMWKLTPEASMQSDNRTNPGVVQNLKGRQLYTDFAVKHYGHINKKRNIERQALWRSIDNESHEDWTGMNYDHMTDETYLELAEWHDDVIAERFWGNESLLIVMCHGLGDVLMLTPTIRALKLENPSLEISVMGLGKIDERDFRTHEIWDNNPLIKRFYSSSIDHHPAWWDDKLMQDRDEPFLEKDIAQLLQLTRFDSIIKVTLQDNPEMHRIDRIAWQFSLEKIDRQLELSPTEADCNWASGFLKTAPISIAHGTKIASVHRFCGHPPKSWGFEEYAETCEILAERGYIVIVWDQDLREIRHEKRQVKGSRIVNMRDYPDITIGQSSAILQACDVHIGADSFPMHLATAAGIPTIGIFTKTRPHETAPMTENSFALCDVAMYQSIPDSFLHENHDRLGCVLGEIGAAEILATLDNFDGTRFKSPEFSQDFPTNCLYDPKEFYSKRHIVASMNPLLEKFPDKLIHNPLKWFDYLPILGWLNNQHPIQEAQRILDIGAGLSVFPLHLASCGHEVWCVDPDIEATQTRIDITAEIQSYDPLSQFRVYSHAGTIFDLPFGQTTDFDIIMLLSVLASIDDDTETVIQAAKYLRPGGLLAMTIDMFEHYIPWPDANRELVTDREGSHCDSRVYDIDALYKRLIEPLKKAGLHLVGVTDFENVDIADPAARVMRGLYTFGRILMYKEEPC